VYDRTLVVFVSDHGENFLDRGVEIAYRHPGLHSDVTRLGLIVKLPHSLHAGEQRGFLLLNSDLSCLALDVVGVARPSAWTCESFLPWLGGDGGRPFRRHLVLEGAERQEVAIRTRRWLYRELAPHLEDYEDWLPSIGYAPDLPRQLYDLDRDPSERENLADRAEYREVVGRLHGLAAAAAEEPVEAAGRLDSEEHREALEALGYLDGRR
jgi:arylsulfatase A-like enzyme